MDLIKIISLGIILELYKEQNNKHNKQNLN